MLRPMNKHLHIATTLLGTLTLVLAMHGCDKGSGPANQDDVPKAAGPNPLSVIMRTDKGAFEIRLRPDLAPRSVTNFCNLVERGFYHGKEISAANTVARTMGETRRVPKYQLPQEFSPTLYFNTSGVVAWSNRPRGEFDDFEPHPTRFFVTVAPQPDWNLKYTPFGTIEDGSDTLLNSKKGDWILSARVVGDPTWLYELHADELAKWNAELDATGHTRAGEENRTIRDLPVNSN